jgi:hypothetical protein
MESGRHRSLVTQLTQLVPGGVEMLRGLKFDSAAERVFHQGADHAALDHQQRFLDSRPAAAGLSFRGRPFDFEWTARLDFGAPRADRQAGIMEIDLSSGSGPFESEHCLNGAGVGVFFRPAGESTFVRVAPYLPYSFRWHDASTLEVARNRGELGVLVREHSPLGGVTVLDSRLPLWNDGTSWYMEHSDEQDGTFNDSNYFFATSLRDYEVWFWFNTSIDFHHEGGPFDFGSSRASHFLFAQLGFIVFEQFVSR